jgi:hypothetical protein
MLQIKQLNAEGKYALVYNSKTSLTFTKKNYLAALPYLKGEKTEKGKDLPKPKFVSLIESAFEDIHQQYSNDIFMAFMQECNMMQEEAEEQALAPIEIPTTDLSLDQILNAFDDYRRDDMEFLMCCNTQDMRSNNPFWTMIISPPSTGKTFLLKLFNHPHLTFYQDDFTANAMLPGRPNKEAAPVFSIIEACRFLSLVINDLSALLSMNKEKSYAYIGTLTNCFGNEYCKASPGGNVKLDAHFNLIAGITIQGYRKAKQIFAVLGSRVLYHTLKKPTVHYLKPKLTGFTESEIAHHIQGYILARRNWDEKITMTPEVNMHLVMSVNNVILLRNLRWSEIWEDMEGQSRLENQFINICEARARLHNRTEILKEDVDFFLPSAYMTIPYEAHILQLAEPYILGGKDEITVQMLKHAISFDMVDTFSYVAPVNNLYPDGTKIEKLSYALKDRFAPVIQWMKDSQREYKLVTVENEEIPSKEELLKLRAIADAASLQAYDMMEN